MSDISFKNRLQEYFQKKHVVIPKYKTIRSGGTDHQPLWQSYIQFFDGTKLKGDIVCSKKLAEASVAEKAIISMDLDIIIPNT